MAEIALLGCYILVWGLFWLPASILVRRLLGGRMRQEWFLDLLAVVFALAVGYAVFWVYLVDRQLGLVGSWLLLAWAVAVIVFRRRIDPGPLARHLSTPVRVAFLFGLLYLGAVTLYGGVERVPVGFVPGSTLDLSSGYFWLAPRCGDELIPLKFADAVAAGRPLRGMLTDFSGEWQFSDRPPLQTGVLLAFWPLAQCGRAGIVSQAVGTMLQMQWVTALAALAAALGWGRRRLSFALLLAGLSGLCYYNALYVWPKLLAAALCFASAAPLVAAWRQRRRLTGPEVLLASSAAALAMLAHGSAAFSLLVVALLAALHRPFLRLGTILPAALVAAVLYLPWSAYQKFVDPPGDRCVQWMLAGKTEIDGMSLGESLREAYSKTTLRQWLADRVTGFFFLFRCPEMDSNLARCLRGWLDPSYRPSQPFAPLYFLRPDDLHYDLPSVAALVRYDQVEQVFRALGLLNLAWPLVAWRLVRGPSLRRAGLGLFLLAGVLSLAAWWLMMYQPLFLLVRNSSLGMMVGLLAAAALVIYDLPPPARWTIAAIHLALGLVAWVAFVPTQFGRSYLALDAQAHAAPLGVALATLAGVLYYCLGARVGYRRAPARPAERRASFSSWELASLALAAALLLVAAGGAVWLKSPLAKLGRRGCVTPLGIAVALDSPGIMGPSALFDGIADNPASYTTWGYATPLVLRLEKPQPLKEIRLHWYDFDGRVYRFRLEVEREGRWATLLDRSAQSVGSLVSVPLDPTPVAAVRITGIYNSNQELNPENKAVHLKELELVPAGL